MNKDKVYIFDNVISEELQNEVQREIFKNSQFKWKSSYSRSITKEELGDSRPLFLDAPKDNKIKIKDNIFWNQSRPGLMVSEYIENGDWVYGMEFFKEWVLMPINGFLSNQSLDIQRIKVNFNAREIIEHKGSCYVPHVDIEDGGGWTGIYYVNNSDGDTVIFNEKTNNPIRNDEEISVKEIIKNKKGRLVLFDQNLLHAGCPPIESDYRVVINYNFKII